MSYTTTRSQHDWRDLAQHSTLRPELQTMYTRTGEDVTVLHFNAAPLHYTVDVDGYVIAQHRAPDGPWPVVANGRDAEIMLENAIADASALALGRDCWRR